MQHTHGRDARSSLIACLIGSTVEGMTDLHSLPAATANQVAGSWRLATAAFTRDGVTTEPYGPDPDGLLVLTATGHFAVYVGRPDLPAFASGDRMAGTADEHRAVVEGALALYGTYRVDADGRFLDQHVLGSTFPNWADLRRGREALTLDVDGDVLTERLRVDAATEATLAWHRAPRVGSVAGDANQVAGVWRMVSQEARLGDDVLRPFGDAPAGCLVFTDDGSFIDVLHRSDLPAFASGDRHDASDAERAAVAEGSFAVFGIYGVDDAGAFLDETLLHGTFPNWDGLSRDRSEITVDVDGDRLVERLDAGGGLHITMVMERVG